MKLRVDPFPYFAQRRGFAPVLAHMAFIFCAVIGLIAAPPASGRMLLVPLGHQGRDSLARAAVAAGARLVGPGPFGGSLLVSGERRALVAALMPAHALVLAGTVGGCGKESVQ